MDDVLGVYQPATKHVYVRGTALTPDVRVTLAHELTHALQDQEVDLAGLERLQGEAGSAARATIEGDAVVNEQAYAATLSPADADSYRRERAADAAAGPAGARTASRRLPAQGNFPSCWRTAPPSPTCSGRRSSGPFGNRAAPALVDRALRRPPKDGGGNRRSRPLAAGLRRRRGPFSPPGIGRPGERTALNVRPGQLVRGARHPGQLPAGMECRPRMARGPSRHLPPPPVDVRGHGDLVREPDQADRFVIAAGDWAETVPGATVNGQGLTAELRSCDPGPAARPPAPVEPPPFQVLSLRASIIGLFLDRKATVGPSACAADQLIARVSPTELIAYDDGEASPGVAQAITAASRQALAACKG